MAVVQKLAVVALRYTVQGICKHAGVEGVDTALKALGQWFSDPSQRLPAALQRANERAWTALELALAGESWWGWAKGKLARGDEQAFGRQVQQFLATMSLPGVADPAFRRECLDDLRIARKTGGLLTSGPLDLRALVHEAGVFARFSDPPALLAAEWQAIDQVAGELHRAGYASLARLVNTRPPQGTSLLAVAVQYFFRREVEADRELFQGLTFAQMEGLSQTQEAGFAALADTLAQHGQQVDELLSLVQIYLLETHAAVLDIQAEQQRQGDQTRALYQAVIDLAQRFDLVRRELHPTDSLSIHDEAERELVKRLVARYRALPEAQRAQLPALLNALGKLEVAAGELDAAQQDFQALAGMTSDAAARAEARYHAYLTALERQQWAEALEALRQAAALDPARWSLFPSAKYESERILGAGGFGVAFLCRHRHSGSRLVVKALRGEVLDRGVATVFREAQVLETLAHPGIIRLRDCDYADGMHQARPYLVMDYFEGVTLEEHVRQHGPLPPAEVLHLARLVAAALRAAHEHGILHRDLKPANLLVRRGPDGWQVKVIDFGLALRLQTLRHTVSNLKSQGRTLLGSSVAGTLDYAAPEQMGKLPGVAVGTYTDVFGFGKTLCYGLFQTPQPRRQHWRNIPEALADLVDQCLAETPGERLPDFAAVLQGLEALATPLTPAPLPSGARGESRTPLPQGARGESRTPLPSGERGRGEGAPAEADKKPAPKPEALDCTGEAGVSVAAVRQAQEAWAQYLGRQVEEEDEIAPGVKMAFVLVPPGKFRMGSPEGEADRSGDEVLHEVTITQPFYLAKYEVTQEQYEAVTGKNPSQFKGGELPVEQVSWEEADAFAKELSHKRGLKHLYRLPTEAEWEYACRGGRPSSQPFGIGDGQSLSSTQANFDGNLPYGGAKKGPYLEKTTPVGQYTANALGLHDMHGNVWEWCADWYGHYPVRKVSDPSGPSEGSVRVLRGGGWGYRARFCRAADRSRNTPVHRSFSLGFRLARVPSGASGL